MSIIVSDVSYHYFNQHTLFESVSFSVSRGGKVSLIGNNGVGKSTLLKLLAGELMPSFGNIRTESKPYYVPQQINIKEQTIAEALGVSEKLNALNAIFGGASEQVYYDTLNDDWEVENRCRQALEYWGLEGIELDSSISLLSGGEKTKVLLAGLALHKPEIVLLDEPTNHLDLSARKILYEYIQNTKTTVVVVSHDVSLLNLLDTTYELSPKGIRLYGGNYDFYREQKEIEYRSLEQQIDAEQTALRVARKKAQEVRERQEKRTSQGERSKQKGGIAAMHKINNEKAKLLYDELDRNKMFKAVVPDPEDRSIMNICFVMEDAYADKDADFLALAKEKGLVGIKGHRSVGGFRASTYNALPIESVQALVDAMKEFESKY